MKASSNSRTVRWALLLLLLVVLPAAVFHFQFRRPVGSGPAGPAVPREAFAKPRTSRPVLLLGIGDSVTAGFGARNGYSYFDRLAANPPGEFADMQEISLKAVLPNLKTVNRSISGSTSLDHWLKQLPKLEPADAQTLGLVVMTTGGNDIIHQYGSTPPREGAMYGATLEQARPWIANFEKRLIAMLALLRERFPGGCHVFLANIYDPTDGVGDMERAGLPNWPDGLKILAAYNEIIQRIATQQKQVHFVNVHDAFLGHGIHCTQPWREHYSHADPHYWYHDNLEDPNERGYDVIRRLFLIEMAKVQWGDASGK